MSSYFSLPERILLVSAVLILTTCCAVQGEVPVQGDRQLLTRLIDAERANLEALQRGRMRIKVSEFSYSSSDEKRMDLTGDAVLVWDADRVRWEYNAVNKDHTPDSPLDERLQDRVLIRTPTQLIAYDPGHELGNGRLVVRPIRRGGYPPQFERARPAQWFVFEGWDRGNWSEYFDPANEKRSKTVTKMDVRRVDDRVIVERSYANGTRMRIEASLAHGGNVVKYRLQAADRTDGGSAGDINSGSLNWAQDESGVWFLAKCHYQTASADNPEQVKWEYDLTMLEVTSTPEVGDFDFSDASIKGAHADNVIFRSRSD